MQHRSVTSTTRMEGGRFASQLDRSLQETLESERISLPDLLTAGWTVEELARTLASTPPFSKVLVDCVRSHLLASAT